MAKITHLPDEIIAIILESKSISIEDIIRFKSTCKRLQQTTLSNHFWKKKFYQKCSTARKYYAQKPKKTFNYVNFEEQLKVGIECIKKLRYYVSLMSDNYLSTTKKEELESFLIYIVRSSKLTYYFVLDEINRINSAQCHLSWSHGQNLTVKYNLELIVSFLKLYRYTYNNIKFVYKPTINLPLLERLITSIAQYLQPHVSYSTIKMWLDNIAQQVLYRLKIKHPAHPIFSTSVEQFLFWKNNNINDHFWNPTETMQIMCVLEKYIFSELDIQKLLQLLLISDLEDKYIDCISGFFSKYLLITIYHSVARRLGIYCILKLVHTNNNSSHNVEVIRIIWRLRNNTETNFYIQESIFNAEYFYIQKVSERELIYPLNIVKGKYHKYDSPPEIDDNKWLFKITYNMIEYLKNELENNNCTNYKWKFGMISSILKNIECIVMCPDCLNDGDVRIKDCCEQITDVIQVRSDVAIEKELKERKEGIIFSVGMIVTYQPRNIWYNLRKKYDGVIIGWHDECEHLTSGGMDMLPFLYDGNNFVYEVTSDYNQPHYIILAENNTVCYAAEDCINICLPKEIKNIEIGRYFYKFEDTRYVPNKNLEQEYPYDIYHDIYHDHMKCISIFGQCFL